MNGLYIVVDSNNGLIYGAYDNDDAAKECLRHVSEDSFSSIKPTIRYTVLNNNYWDNKK
jgi:hypothetical protein